MKSLTHTFSDLQSLRNYISKLNKETASSITVEFNPECKYVKLKCKFQGCVFQHWFKYQLDADRQPAGLTMFRNINANHSITKHF